MAAHTTLTFLGAAGTVTGSKFLLTVGTRRVLVEAGMFQGEKEWRLKNWEEFAVDPASISDIVLTHAHMDHVGYLPALTSRGYDGPIWCTEGTRQLAEIVLRDAAKLQEQEAEEANEGGYSGHHPALPLYTTDDVEAMLGQFVSVAFDTEVELTGTGRGGFTPDPGERVTVRMTRAGHILGSASVSVRTPHARVLFSGDLGRADHPVIKGREVPEDGAQIVVLESTYGDREHPEPPNLPHEAFADVIRRTIGRGGTVLVPAFAIDRTEVVLKTISDLERDGRIPDVPVYVNSPMGTRALAVYQTLAGELRDDLRPQDFVRIPDLTAVESAEDSRRLTGRDGHGPAVIISSSGMATGGRVLHHLEELLPDPRNAVVLTGYQAVGTRGRQLAEGARQVKIRGRYVPVKAEILHDQEFSVHGDCSDLLDWLGALTPRPEQVFCVHGEPDSTAGLARRVTAELGIPAVVPRHGEVVLLGDGVAPRTGAERPGTRTSTRPAAPAARATPTRYRLISGPQGEAFDAQVSSALSEGWHLAGSPSLAFDDTRVIAGQAVVKEGDDAPGADHRRRAPGR